MVARCCVEQAREILARADGDVQGALDIYFRDTRDTREPKRARRDKFVSASVKSWSTLEVHFAGEHHCDFPLKLGKTVTIDHLPGMLQNGDQSGQHLGALDVHATAGIARVSEIALEVRARDLLKNLRFQPLRHLTAWRVTGNIRAGLPFLLLQPEDLRQRLRFAVSY